MFHNVTNKSNKQKKEANLPPNKNIKIEMNINIIFPLMAKIITINKILIMKQ